MKVVYYKLDFHNDNLLIILGAVGHLLIISFSITSNLPFIVLSHKNLQNKVPTAPAFSLTIRYSPFKLIIPFVIMSDKYMIVKMAIV